jgi:delta 1-pyrroline-5-carboxylate dehydrogenase
MNLHIWRDHFSFLAIAHARSVDHARTLLLNGELGESGDGTCPERDRARKIVQTETPELWQNATEAFVLTDSAELREQEEHSERLKKLADQLEAALEPFIRHQSSDSTFTITVNRSDVEKARSLVASAKEPQR